MKVLHFLNFQCATHTGIPRWHFKLLHVFELEGTGKKETMTKEKKKMMTIKNKMKINKLYIYIKVGGGHRKSSGRLHYLFSHTKYLDLEHFASSHMPPRRISAQSSEPPKLLGSPDIQLR